MGGGHGPGALKKGRKAMIPRETNLPRLLSAGGGPALGGGAVLSPGNGKTRTGGRGTTWETGVLHRGPPGAIKKKKNPRGPRVSERQTKTYKTLSHVQRDHGPGGPKPDWVFGRQLWHATVTAIPAWRIGACPGTKNPPLEGKNSPRAHGGRSGTAVADA